MRISVFIVDAGDLMLRRTADGWAVPSAETESAENAVAAVRRLVTRAAGIEVAGDPWHVFSRLQGEAVFECHIPSRVAGARSGLGDSDWYAPAAIPGLELAEPTRGLIERWVGCRTGIGLDIQTALGGRPRDVVRSPGEVTMIGQLTPPWPPSGLPASVTAETIDGTEWAVDVAGDGVAVSFSKQGPAALWFDEAVEGDQLLTIAARGLVARAMNLNSYWEGSGSITTGADKACIAQGFGGYFSNMAGLEYLYQAPVGGHANGSASINRLWPCEVGPVYYLAVGRKTIPRPGKTPLIYDFFFIDGEPACNVLNAPLVKRRDSSKLALASWGRGTETDPVTTALFHRAWLYELAPSD